LVLDLILIGAERLNEFAGDVTSEYDFMKFDDPEVESKHPLKSYC